MASKQIIKFFIVEDDSAFRNILKDILRKVEESFNGNNVVFEIESFYSIAEAQARIYTNPDIVLLDYYIVDDDFKQVTSDRLLQDIMELEKDTKVIIVSGEEKPDIVKSLKALGASYYISKNPKTIARIIPTIKSLVRKKLVK